MRLQSLANAQAGTAVLLGQILADIVRQKHPLTRLNDAEFKVFSQFGEDGIIQHLLSLISIPDRTFVEIGVEDYGEANTRFLLVANKWRSLVIDSNAAQIRAIQASDLSWRCSLTAQAAFVTRDNINSLLKDAAIQGDIGLLSIDMDGNDYWVWEALTDASPKIVVCEFNRLFGCQLALTIPYHSDFVSTEAHLSHFYYGASLPALTILAAKKGYSLVGCTSEGVNAFFVRDDVRNGLKPLTAAECYATITPPIDHRSTVSKLSLISHLPLCQIDSGMTSAIRELISSMWPKLSSS